jgi:hypothetical protein
VWKISREILGAPGDIDIRVDTECWRQALHFFGVIFGPAATARSTLFGVAPGS